MQPTDASTLQLGRSSRRWRTRLWREWCFARVTFHHFRYRLLILMLLLGGGGLCFRVCEPEKQHTFAEAMFYVWCLIFGQPPDAFPRAPLLQILYFTVPVIGLIVILEGIVEFAMVIRDRRRQERNWCKLMAAALSNHIILVGLGKLGIRTFRLLQQLGEQVVCIERNAENQFLDEVRQAGAPLFIGDARREEWLREANIRAARSIVIASNDDLANLEVALDARQANPKIRVVLRMFDQNMADKIRQGFNLQIAVSQSALSAPTFVMSALADSIVAGYVLDDRLVVVQRRTVRSGGPFCDRTVADVLRHMKLSILQQRQADGRTCLLPPPETRLAAGDELLVQGDFVELERLAEPVAV